MNVGLTIPLYGVLCALAVAMTPALLAALVLMRGLKRTDPA